MHYMRGDFTEPDTFSHLKRLLAERLEEINTANVLFYLATADRLFGPIIEQLGSAGLTNNPGEHGGV